MKLRNNLPEIFLVIFILIYFIYFSTVCIIRHENLYSMRYDLGNMDQTVWNSLQGRLFTMTDPAGDVTVSRFAFHSDFFLVFLAPFYLIYSSPIIILILQSLILAIGAIPIFLLASQQLKSKNLALVFSSAYLLFPALQRSNLYEFHAVTFATTFILFAFYFADIKKYNWFFLFSFLASSTKEEIPLLILGIGFYILIKNKNLKIGLITIILSLLWFACMIWTVIPSFRLGAHHFGVGFYNDYGDSPGKILFGLLTNPLKALSVIFSNSRLLYLNQILLPVGFLSLFSPLLLLALPELLINLLSSNSPMYSIYYQYTAGITPFIFISAIFGFKSLINRLPWLKKSALVAFLTFIIIGAYLYGPLPFAAHADINFIKFPNPYAPIVRSWTSKIPKEASVSVTNNIAPHFSQRKELYSFPIRYDKVTYNIILAEGIYEMFPAEKLKKYVNDLKNNKNYQLIYNYKNFYIFKQK